MTLTCEQRPPKFGAAPHFRFLRDSRALGRGWSSSPRLELAAVWQEDSGAYWCEARPAGDTVTWGGSATRSRSVHVRVHSERQGPGQGAGRRAGRGGAGGRGRGSATPPRESSLRNVPRFSLYQCP